MGFRVPAQLLMPGARAEKTGSCKTSVGNDSRSLPPRAAAQTQVDPETPGGAAVSNVLPARHSPQEREVGILNPEESPGSLGSTLQLQQPGAPTVISHDLSKDARREVRNAGRSGSSPHRWGKGPAE